MGSLKEQIKPEDIHLMMAVGQGYVPETCLLPGMIVMALISKGDDPCSGCNLDRAKCKGRTKE